MGTNIVHVVIYLVPWKNLDSQISFLCQIFYLKAGTLLGKMFGMPGGEKGNISERELCGFFIDKNYQEV